MILEQIWTANDYRNFNYLVACPESGEALAIDPVDHEKCLAIAKDKGWDITQVVNTHEHGDHIAGNQPVIDATGAKLLAHANAKDSIPGVGQGLGAGDVIKVGKTVELECLDTPGHTMSHVCLLWRGEMPALICGDTLFNAGVGNCGSGDPVALYQTFAGQLAQLADRTLVYPGHDYIATNLKFTLDREPDNPVAKALLADIADQDPADPLVTHLALEKQINTFLRLDQPAVIEQLHEAFPDLPAEPDRKTVFLKLRELRNSW